MTMTVGMAEGGKEFGRSDHHSQTTQGNAESHVTALGGQYWPREAWKRNVKYGRQKQDLQSISTLTHESSCSASCLRQAGRYRTRVSWDVFRRLARSSRACHADRRRGCWRDRRTRIAVVVPVEGKTFVRSRSRKSTYYLEAVQKLRLSWRFFWWSKALLN